MTFVPGVTSSAGQGRLYVLAEQSLCVLRDAAGPRIPVGAVDAEAIYLGALDGADCFAQRLAAGATPPAGSAPVPLRQLYGALPDDDFALAGRALALTAWDADHRCCGRCGAPTTRSTSERLRSCTRCDHGAYPRLSPAVIVLVERDGRALLARNARFPVPFFSALAGFVEVGETLEQTVARELREEAGIEVRDVRYFGSQPWPFSGSLMIGFTAAWAAGELVLEPSELAEGDWFAPSALPPLPPPLSIARALIDDFVRRHG